MSRPTIVAFSGAGLSAESGVQTFRAADGLWENHRVEDVASPEGWRRDQKLVLDFYAARFSGVATAEPNPAHDALVAMEADAKVVNITQNIDNLLERAGASEVFHLHGRINVAKCEWHHDIFGKGQDFQCGHKQTITASIKQGSFCPDCGGQLRPDVVWFGEAVDMRIDWLRGLAEEVKQTKGAFLCIGTAALVYPAASLIPIFQEAPHKYIFNLEEQFVPGFKSIVGPAGQTLPPRLQEIFSKN